MSRSAKNVKGKPANLESAALDNSDSGFGKTRIHANDSNHARVLTPISG
jgi:hypothetical protein